MRYELVPNQQAFISVFCDIPNNAYVYSNELSSLEMDLIRKTENQFVRFNQTSKVQTANTRFGMFFNNYPNDEIYMVDLRGKYGEFNQTIEKADIELCDVRFNLNVKYMIYVNDSIEFISGNRCFSVNSYLNTMNHKIEQILYDVLNESSIDAKEMITTGYQLNEINRKLRYAVESLHIKRGLTIKVRTLALQITNYKEISEFYNRDRKRKIELEDKIVDRFIDTVFNQYNRTETISDNQLKVLEAYFNNAIIESKDFKPEEFMNQFLSYQKTYSLSELIDNLDQANKRLIRTKALEDK